MVMRWTKKAPSSGHGDSQRESARSRETFNGDAFGSRSTMCAIYSLFLDILLLESANVCHQLAAAAAAAAVYYRPEAYTTDTIDKWEKKKHKNNARHTTAGQKMQVFEAKHS
eukprot:scaffold4050_cov55-Cylindrotheca_fusiformis.AAC.7